MASDSNYFKGPLFICGMSRSGTTYLRRLINSFPGVSLMYESTIIRTAYEIFYNEDILKDRITFRAFLKRLDDREKRNMGGKTCPIFAQPSEFYDNLYISFINHRDFNKFCQELCSVGMEQNGLWGNKLVDSEELKMLLTDFPNARYIIIIRDPRSVAFSNREFFGGHYYTSALIWTDTARTIQDIEKNHIERSIMLLRYEDLVRDSKVVLNNIASFIGRELPEDLSTANKAHTRSIEKWRDYLTNSQARIIEEICFSEMRHFGYNPDFASSQKKLNKIRFYWSLLLNITGRLKKRRGDLRSQLRLRSLPRYLNLYRKTNPAKKF